jgi:hypothetical protein
MLEKKKRLWPNMYGLSRVCWVVLLDVSIVLNTRTIDCKNIVCTLQKEFSFCIPNLYIEINGTSFLYTLYRTVNRYTCYNSIWLESFAHSGAQVQILPDLSPSLFPFVLLYCVKLQ